MHRILHSFPVSLQPWRAVSGKGHPSRRASAILGAALLGAALVAAPSAIGSGGSPAAVWACASETPIATVSGIACVHGDDTALTGTASAEGIDRLPIPCHGDGTSGNRIALYYAYIAGHRDRVARMRASIRASIEQANTVVYRSSRETGGARWLRVLTDSRCQPIVRTLKLPRAARQSFVETISAAERAGLQAANRKYLLFTDASAYCGIATLQHDDRPGPRNLNNAGPSWARLDRACWGGYATAHEIMHMLGSVQASAPHYDGTGHCTDDYDLMCYQNPGGKRVWIRCQATLADRRLDCGKDDYFNTSPAAGSYLARHWNTARSSFLYNRESWQRPPGAVAAPHAVMQTLSTASVRWRPPATGHAARYAVTKNGAVVWRGTATHWTDRDATPGAGNYRVSARNHVGSGPWSPAADARLPRPAAPGAVWPTSATSVKWTYDSHLAAGFALYGLTRSGTARHLSNWPANARSATDGTLALFRDWDRYRVCAYNSAGMRCRDEAR